MNKATAVVIFLTAFVIAFVLTVLLGGAIANADQGGGNVKVGICHRTASDSNPYVYIEVDEEAVPAHIGNTLPGHKPTVWKSDGTFRGVSHVAGDAKDDYLADGPESCQDFETPPPPPPARAIADVDFTGSCEDPALIHLTNASQDEVGVLTFTVADEDGSRTFEVAPGGTTVVAVAFGHVEVTEPESELFVAFDLPAPTDCESPPPPCRDKDCGPPSPPPWTPSWTPGPQTQPTSYGDLPNTGLDAGQGAILAGLLLAIGLGSLALARRWSK